MDDSIDLQMPQTPQMQAKYTHLEKNLPFRQKKKLRHTQFNNYSDIHGKILISLQKYTQKVSIFLLLYIKPATHNFHFHFTQLTAPAHTLLGIFRNRFFFLSVSTSLRSLVGLAVRCMHAPDMIDCITGIHSTLTTYIYVRVYCLVPQWMAIVWVAYIAQHTTHITLVHCHLRNAHVLFICFFFFLI